MRCRNSTRPSPTHTHADVISSSFACVRRTNSIKGLEAFADNANAYNRMLLNHLSISEAYHPPTFSVGELPWEEIAEQCRHERQQEPFGGDSGLADDDGGGDGDYGLMFSVGDSGSDAEGEQSSSGDEYERRHSGGGNGGVSGMCFSLSPPGTSSLARRRMRSSSSSGDSFDLDKENLSPQKIPSAIF